MKRRRFKGTACVFLLMMTLFLLSFCVSRSSVIGKWKEVGKTATIEFWKDGTFEAVDNQDMAVSGKYTLSEDGHLQCAILQDGKTVDIVKLTISIHGDELTLTSPNARGFEIYRRER